MKNANLKKQFSGLLLSAFFLLCLAGCEDETNRKTFNFRLACDTYEVPAEQCDDISILSGNGNYIFNIEDPAIIGAVHVTDYDPPFGVIRIEARQKGNTVLSVTDPVAGTTLDLHIKVTDNYLGVIIKESDIPAVEKHGFMYLVKNEGRDFYFFREDELGYPSELTCRGTYEFTAEDNLPYLILHYPEENGGFTENPLTPVPHKYNIVNSDPQTFGILRIFLDVNPGEDAPGVRTSVISPVYMRMEEEPTGYTATGYFSNQYRIPVNTLN